MLRIEDSSVKYVFKGLLGVEKGGKQSFLNPFSCLIHGDWTQWLTVDRNQQHFMQLIFNSSSTQEKLMYAFTFTCDRSALYQEGETLL